MRWKARLLGRVSLALVLWATSATGQIVGVDPTGLVELRVRVTYQNDQAVPAGLQVDLVTSSELAVTQGFTDEVGQVTFERVPSGYYRIKISGIGIEDVTTNRFLLSRGEGTHNEYVRVTAKAPSGMVSLGSGPPVSAAELNLPDSARREFDAGMAALNLKNWPEAQKRFEKALAIYPPYARASTGLGVVLLNRGEPARARQAFENAYRLDDHLAWAERNLGILAYKEKRYPDAEDMLTKSLAGEPLNPDALLYLANTQLLLGKSEEALSTAHRLHNLEHAEYTLVHLVAARALENLKRPEEAAAEYQLYLQESPTGPAAARARASLQALQGQVSR